MLPRICTSSALGLLSRELLVVEPAAAAARREPHSRPTEPAAEKHVEYLRGVHLLFRVVRVVTGSASVHTATTLLCVAQRIRFLRAVPVVSCSLISIRKTCERLRYRFENLLRFFRFALVGMQLQRQFSVCLFYRAVVRVFLNAQDVVVRLEPLYSSHQRFLLRGSFYLGLFRLLRSLAVFRRISTSFLLSIARCPSLSLSLLSSAGRIPRPRRPFSVVCCLLRRRAV
mmetsp:Transcript_5266/g.17603  ORF Transcript_5266/g.17603 Transcript_5266/m.17603 type:complete len:228 (+) Transcript_5266:538-1221(+)